MEDLSNAELIQAMRRVAVETWPQVCLSCGYEHSCDVRGCAVISEAIRRLEAILPPPNAPLTKEELREMNGEPVWVDYFGKSPFFSSKWMLVTKFGAIGRDYCMILHEYGKNWLAYRRKPEGGEEEDDETD